MMRGVDRTSIASPTDAGLHIDPCRPCLDDAIPAAPMQAPATTGPDPSMAEAGVRVNSAVFLPGLVERGWRSGRPWREGPSKSLVLTHRQQGRRRSSHHRSVSVPWVARRGATEPLGRGTNQAAQVAGDPSNSPRSLSVPATGPPPGSHVYTPLYAYVKGEEAQKSGKRGRGDRGVTIKGEQESARDSFFDEC
jgi:hypothetical protein